MPFFCHSFLSLKNIFFGEIRRFLAGFGLVLGYYGGFRPEKNFSLRFFFHFS